MNKIFLISTVLIMLIITVVLTGCKNKDGTELHTETESNDDGSFAESIMDIEITEYEIELVEITDEDDIEDYYLSDGSDTEDLELKYLEDMINSGQLEDYYDEVDYSEIPVG